MDMRSWLEQIRREKQRLAEEVQDLELREQKIEEWIDADAEKEKV